MLANQRDIYINLTERTRTMRLSKRQLRTLVTLYEDVHGKTLSFEQAQEVGLAIMRLVLLKEMKRSQLNVKEITDGILQESSNIK